MEGIKEELGWLKLVFGVLVAIDVSLVGWLAEKHASVDRWSLIAGVVATAVLTGAIVRVVVTVYKRIRELEEL